MLSAIALAGFAAGATNDAQFSAPSAAAEEAIATIGLQAGNAGSGRHFQPLQDGANRREPVRPACSMASRL